MNTMKNNIFLRFSKGKHQENCNKGEIVASEKISFREMFTVSNELGTISLLAIAIPMLVENVLNNMIGFINSAVLSGYSESAVAATGTAASVINLFYLLQNIITLGMGVAVSNYIGANDTKGARKTSYTALCLCTLIGLSISVVLSLLSSPLMTLMNLEGEVLSEAIVYFRIRSAFFFVAMITASLTSLLRCYGYSALTVVSGFVTITLNLILNVWVVYFPQYSPVTGVAGIAVGSVVSQIAGLIVAIVFVCCKKIGFGKTDSVGDFWRFTKRIMRIGLPSGVSAGVYSLSQVITAAFVAIIGMQAVSAKIYYSNILIYSYLFSVCFGSANSFLVGRLVGAKDFERAKMLSKRLVRLTCLINLCISVAIVLLRVPLVSIFTDSDEIISLALWIFLIDIIAEQARGVSQVYEYALRGAGDMKFMMVVAIVSCWVFGVGLAYLLSIPLGMGLIGCWIGMVIDESVRAVFSYFRWQSEAWNKKDVLR